MDLPPTIGVAELASSPLWLPLELTPGGVRLLRLLESDYQAASFLDQRLLATGFAQGACSQQTLRRAAASLRPSAHFVFHIGHVGSTLASRLIGAHADFFCVREPALLRSAVTGPLGTQPSAPRIDLSTAVSLFSRRWRPAQQPVVKATSFVSELASDILGAPEQPRAILMFTDPARYVCSILAGPNSRIETRLQFAARRERVRHRMAQQWWSEPQSEGEQIAMTWLCEMLALHAAAIRFPASVAWVHFDRFLMDPAAAMMRILSTLRAQPSFGQIEAIVTGPLMHRYSKAPEHPYDAALRRAVLQSAEREHPVELRRGLDWLQRAARGSESVHNVMAFAAV